MFRYASTIVCGAVLILGGIAAIINGKSMAQEANAALAWLEPLAGLAHGSTGLTNAFEDFARQQGDEQFADSFGDLADQQAANLADADAMLAQLRRRAQTGTALFYGGICAVIVGAILVLAGLGSGLAFLMKNGRL